MPGAAGLEGGPAGAVMMAALRSVRASSVTLAAARAAFLNASLAMSSVAEAAAPPPISGGGASPPGGGGLGGSARFASAESRSIVS